MTSLLARRSVLALVGALALPGCGDDEPTQRKAFITFLQTRIVDKPGVHVPRPTVEESKSWGDYAQHYAIITAFNDALSQRVTAPMNQAIARGAITSLQDLVDRRSDLLELRRGMGEIRAELDKQIAAAEKSRALLKQPVDLKPVFDAAYERDVIGPAKVFQEIMPATENAMMTAIEVADFIAEHRAAITLRGAQVQVSDPALQRDLSSRLANMNARGKDAQAAQQRLRALITGSGG